MTSRRPIVIALLAVLVIAGVLFRCRDLGASGFSEDEINKVQAVRAYARGQWSANAEHPMLMKLMMWASSAAADAWNRGAGRTVAMVSPEAALRLPNALAGAAAVVPLFLLVRKFFGPAVAGWAAALLALDVNVTGVNRIGKEDTLLVFFLLCGSWLYEEARYRHIERGTTPHVRYAASGAAFGLMLASKYMAYYLGLWAVFGFAARAEAKKRARASGGPPGAEIDQRASAWFFLAMGAAFVASNPAILLPETWRYLLHYVAEKTITHHGALFAGRVYINMVSATPWGLPWHFYLTYLVTKTPLPILAAMAVGIVELVRRRGERGAVFLRVFLVFFLLPASLMASKFGRYLLPTFAMLDIVAALGVVRTLELIARGQPALRARAAAVALAATVLVAPLVAEAGSSPYPSAYQNALGRRVSPVPLFPNDELYDLGMREAVEWTAGRAAHGASIASDAPGVVAEYLRRYGRPDIEVRSLSMEGPGRPPVEAWVLVQNSHACFESQAVVEQLRRRQAPVFTVRARGAAAVETFRLPW